MSAGRAQHALSLAIAVVLGTQGACTLEFDPRLLDDGGALDGGEGAEDGGVWEPLGPVCPEREASPLGLEEVPLGLSERMDTGIVLEDLDADGDLDLLVSEGALPPSTDETGEVTGHAYENRSTECGSGEMVRVTEQWLPPAMASTHRGASSMIVVPLVDDLPDIVAPDFFQRGQALRGRAGVPRWSPIETFFVPRGDGRLYGTGAAAGDLDGDGRLDLVLGGYGSAGGGHGQAIVSDDEGVLRALGESEAIGAASRIWIGDFDDDGVQEVLAIPDDGVARLLRLEGETLVDDGGVGGLEHVSSTGQVAIGDLDNDGDLDVFQIAARSTDGALVAMVLENEGGTWTPRSGEDLAGIGDAIWNGGNATTSFLVGLADLDLDGLLDVVMTDGSIDVYRNASASLFAFERLDAAQLGVGASIASQGSRVAVGDVDSDGDPDIGVASTAGAHLLRNTVSGPAWLRVRLRGPAGNARGVGATVCAFAPGMLPERGCRGPGLVGMRVILSASVQSQALEALIATPGLERADVRVVWPSGIGTTDVQDVPVSRGMWVSPP